MFCIINPNRYTNSYALFLRGTAFTRGSVRTLWFVKNAVLREHLAIRMKR